MDYRAIVNRTPGLKKETPAAVIEPVVHAYTPPGDAVPRVCQQAIFTSQRSPMGEGYRLIAASPGLTVAQKAELTRRAPSHGALVAEHGPALGLLAFPLPQDRYCVALSRLAGREYSARGGARVWTHLVVLDEEAFAAYKWNAVRVHVALAAQQETVPSGKCPTALPALTLPAWSMSPGKLPQGREDDLCRLLLALLGAECAIARGLDGDWTLLEWALDLLPAGTRRQASFSYGIGYSPQRQLHLALLDVPQHALERSTWGQPIRWYNLGDDEPAGPTPFDAWLAFVQIRAIQGRLRSAARLASRIEGEASGTKLHRLADLSLDRDVAARADEEELAILRKKYESFQPKGELEAELYAPLQELLVPPPEPAEESADNAPAPGE